MTIHRAVVLPSGFHNTGKLVTHNDHLSTRAAPKVKPLVWDVSRDGSLFCLTTVADYKVTECEDGFPELEIKSCDAEEWETHQDVSVAKAAAQADYTYRILDALE